MEVGNFLFSFFFANRNEGLESFILLCISLWLLVNRKRNAGWSIQIEFCNLLILLWSILGEKWAIKSCCKSELCPAPAVSARECIRVHTNNFWNSIKFDPVTEKTHYGEVCGNGQIIPFQWKPCVRQCVTPCTLDTIVQHSICIDWTMNVPAKICARGHTQFVQSQKYLWFQLDLSGRRWHSLPFPYVNWKR